MRLINTELVLNTFKVFSKRLS